MFESENNFSTTFDKKLQNNEERNVVTGLQVAGSFGLGRRTERGDMLVEFCERRTCFEHSLRRRYTWKVSGAYPASTD